MKGRLMVIGAAALCCVAASAFASGNSVFTGDGLDGYSYDEWKAAQDVSKSSSGVGVAVTFEPGGYQTGISTTSISLEARFRTWLESAGRALRSDALKGLMIIFR